MFIKQLRYQILICLVIAVLSLATLIELLHRHGRRNIDETASKFWTAHPTLTYEYPYPEQANADLVELWDAVELSLQTLTHMDYELPSNWWSKGMWAKTFRDPAEKDNLSSREQHKWDLNQGINPDTWQHYWSTVQPVVSNLRSQTIQDARYHWGQQHNHHLWDPENIFPQIPDLLACRMMAQVLAVAAQTEEKPLESLQALDGLTRAIDGQSLMEGMVSLACLGIADEAWCTALARGRITAKDFLQRQLPTWERIWIAELWVQTKDIPADEFFGSSSDISDYVVRPLYYASEGHEQTAVFDGMVLASDHLINIISGNFTTPPTYPDAPWWSPGVRDIMIPNLIECNMTIAQNIAHRESQPILAELLSDYRKGIKPPTTNAEFQQRYSKLITGLPPYIAVEWMQIDQHRWVITVPSTWSLASWPEFAARTVALGRNYKTYIATKNSTDNISSTTTETSTRTPRVRGQWPRLELYLPPLTP